MEKIDIEKIKDKLLNDDEISDYEKKVAIYSIHRLKDEELQDVTKENIRERLLKVLDDLKKAEPTSLTEERIRKELEIIETISDPNSSERDIIEASFKVDCLCFDNDLTPEKTTTILEYLDNQKKRRK